MKNLLILTTLFLSTTTFAQELENVNTPKATDGANYSENVVTGLDDYNKRKQALQEKAEKTKLKKQKEKELQAQKAAYEEVLKLAKEKAAKNNAPASNSNQDYFDKQNKALESIK